MGEAGVEWNAFIKRWVLHYNCFNNKPDQLDWIYMRVAQQAWGPWSEPQTIFNPDRDNGFCYFIHRAVTATRPACDNLSDSGGQSTGGSAYGPYFISPFTTGNIGNGTSTFYYTLSTFIPNSE